MDTDCALLRPLLTHSALQRHTQLSPHTLHPTSEKRTTEGGRSVRKKKCVSKSSPMHPCPPSSSLPSPSPHPSKSSPPSSSSPVSFIFAGAILAAALLLFHPQCSAPSHPLAVASVSHSSPLFVDLSSLSASAASTSPLHHHPRLSFCLTSEHKQTILLSGVCLVLFYSPFIHLRTLIRRIHHMASWDQIRNEVRSFRASVQPTVTTIRDFVFDSRHDRIYFLANDLTKSSKAPMLFRVDLPKPYSEDRDRDRDLDQDMDDEHDHMLFERDMESSSSYEDLSSDQDMGLVPFHPDTYQFAGPPSLHHTIPALIPGPRGSHPYHQNDNPGSSFSFGKASSSSPPSGGISPGTPSLTDQILAAAPVLTWVPVLSEDWLKHATLHSPSERLSSFQFEPQVNRLMFPYGAAIYIGNIQEVRL